MLELEEALYTSLDYWFKKKRELLSLEIETGGVKRGEELRAPWKRGCFCFF